MKILICDAFDAGLPERLKVYGEVTEDKKNLPDAHIALVRSKTQCDKTWFDQAKQLKMVIRGGVGMDNIDVEYAKQKGVIALNTPEASSISVAELAMALMIALPNKIIPGHQGMSQNKWLKKECERTELYGKTLGLIGAGRIAREVAIRAKAFGMKIIAYDPSFRQSDFAEIKASLEEIWKESDYISLHVPLTESTKEIINKNTIAKMKDGVIIINTARGKCVVEQDIADALKSGKIGGYGNDVWYNDPPASSPLIGAPNTILTPHIGASSNENLLRISDIIVEKIKEFVSQKSSCC
ncbi:MAG: hydroxyacid dehydrogenase [Candidatus Brocadiae bacterium]|nr:hydroxyacid dehydrogenase [Candidatus Brocadiia bacterium]